MPSLGSIPHPSLPLGPREGSPTPYEAAPPDISELLEQALEKYRREAAGGAQAELAAIGIGTYHSGVGALIAQHWLPVTSRGR